MKTAKNYEQYEKVGEPYEAHKHWFQKININGQITEVRLYNDEEYEKMYPSHLIPVKDKLGFTNGSVTLIYGNTADLKDWLISINARYNKLFGWYAVEPVDPIPEGISTAELKWSQISVNNKYLRPDQEIVEIISSIMAPESASQFVGEIGEKITANLRINKVIELDTRYGKTNMHIMEDAHGNKFTWMTGTRHLVEGQVYSITGTIKTHDAYKGEKRNALVRCQVKEI